MKSFLQVVALVSFSIIATSCATTGTMSRLGGAIVGSRIEPVVATTHSSITKTGKACSGNYLGIYAGGDSSIEAAKRDGGITNVATVDVEIFNVLSIYGSVCTIVKGN